MRTKVIVGLDLVRFGAAAMVMWFHLAFWSWAPPAAGVAKAVTQGVVMFPELVNASWFGWVGVEIFFVLSGFVIANSAASASPRSFLRARVLRLVPGAWICASITLLVLLCLGAYPLWDLGARYLRALTFWPTGPWIDDVYWTLAIELVFYAVVFVVLRLNRYRTLPYVLAFIGSVSSIFWLAQALTLAFAGPDALSWVSGMNQRLLELSLLQHGSFFALGALSWQVAGGMIGGRWRAVILLCAAGGLCEVLLPALSRAQSLGDPTLAAAPVMIWLTSLALIAAAVRCNDTKALQANAVFARRLGLSTYPLYLLHDAVGAAIMKSLFALGANRWLALTGAIATVCVVSWIVALSFEPLLRARIAARLGSDAA